MSELVTDHLKLGSFYSDNHEYPGNKLQIEVDSLCRTIEKNCGNFSPFIYLYATNTIKTVIALFAIIKSGKIVVLLDPDIGQLELSEHYKELPPCAEMKFDNECESVRFNVVVECSVAWEELSDVCLILYAYADDGRARAVLLTNTNILSNALTIGESNQVNSDSVSYALIPLCHLFALQTGVIAPSISGGSVILSEMISQRNTKEIFSYFSRMNVTHFYSIPMIYYLLSKVDKQELKSVMSFVSGGYKLPSSVFEACMRKNVIIHEGYGLTETSPICTWHGPKDPIKIASVGKPFGDCSIKIDIISDGESYGEILVSGSNVMKGYYGDEKTAKLSDCWFHTGDLGYVDKNNYLYLTGMNKKMFNVSGKKVYKRELERLLAVQGNVKNVELSVNWNPLQGDSIAAVIRLADDTPEYRSDFIAWCRKNISSYKIPRKIEFASDTSL